MNTRKRRCNTCGISKNWNATIQEHGNYICKLCRNLRKEPPKSKICTLCKELKPLSDFGFRHNRVIGYSRCQQCVNSVARNKTKAVGYSSRDWHLKRRYGITPGDYATMLDSQHGVCGACGGPPNKSGGPHFHVDHNHTTNKVRGLLCGHCNHILGMTHDDPTKLQQLIEYLHRTK